MLDSVLDAAAVLRIVRKHVPGASMLNAVDESGRKGRAYFIDDGIVLKTHRPERLRARVVEEFETSLEKEAFVLDLAGSAQLPTPRLLGYGREGTVEYICMTKAAGVALRRVEFGQDQRRSALRDLGRVLCRLHAIPVGAARASGLFPDDGSAADVALRLHGVLTRMAEAIHTLPDEWRPSLDIDAAAGRTLTAFPSVTRRALLHSNPAAEHVFIDPTTSRVTGLIDWADAYIGHPAFDLRPWRQRQDRDALLAGYQDEGAVDGDFIAARNVGLILGIFARFLRRQEPPAVGERQLTELLAEL